MIFQTRLWAAALIIIIVVVGGFALSVPRVQEVLEPSESKETLTSSTTPVVTLHDSYKKGVRTITGSVMTPDACTSVSAQASLADASSTDTSILLDLSTSPDTGVCLEVPTEMAFSTSLAAPKDAAIETRVNGIVATTTGP